MAKSPKNNRKGTDNSKEHSVSYEEIMHILNKRHDFERFGDNDIM